MVIFKWDFMSECPDYNENNRIKDGVESFLRLHSLYQHRIYGYIMSLVGDWSQADDIYQETTSVLWTKYSQFVPGTDYLAWALRIAHFQVLSHLKKANLHRKYFSSQTLDKLNEIAVSAGTESQESLDALRHCIKLLPERSKKLLSLRYEDGTTVQKIAQRVRESVHSLYKEYQKIHTQLFQCIRRQLDWK
jgi:RNA polymerase sigma-70 factor (ECF subfamily)